MFLKSLLLRGFKSFPDKTELLFEPGITILVGPNGSGKSNLVEAISWVLGEQGPRSLRGGKMEDVIFAGSKIRPALGMAEVTLTIDNSAGLLPIDFDQVTISRLLFRSGESEYRLNGAPCRLLDIQEVLSDSGIGREQHTIIGQGQLDEILQADPVQMRGFIEEAAGVTKHRRRKERALRKITAAEENLSRLSDLLSEIRRQLRPLREQAEVANRHAAMSDELKQIMLVQASRELSDLRERLGTTEDTDPDAPLREKESELRELDIHIGQAEAERQQLFGEIEIRRETAWSLARSQERLTSLGRLASERSKGLKSALLAADEDVHRARLADIRREIEETERSIAEARAAQQQAEALSSDPNQSLVSADTKIKRSEEELAPARSAHRESLSEAITLKSEITALERAAVFSEAEMSQIKSRREGITASLRDSSSKLDEARRNLQALEQAEASLGKSLEESEVELSEIESRLRETNQTLQSAQESAAMWRNRAASRTSSKDSARRIIESGIPGVVGVLSDLIDAPPQLQPALDAIAGPASGVMVVDDASAVPGVLSELGDDDAVALLIGGARGASISETDVEPFADAVTIRNERAVEALSTAFIAPDIATAVRLASQHPDATFVTRDGAMASGTVLIRSPKDAALQAVRSAEALDEAKSNFDQLQSEFDGAEGVRNSKLAELNEADARLSAAAETIASLEKEDHALKAQLDALTESENSTRQSLAEQERRLAELRNRLPDIESRIELHEAELQELQEAHGAGLAERQAALSRLEEARMGAARSAERTRLLEERVGRLRHQLDQAEGATEGLGERRSRIERAMAQIADIVELSSTLARRAENWALEAENHYQGGRRELETADGTIQEMRDQRAGLAGAIDDLRVRAREGDIARNEVRLRVRILEERMIQEWNADPEESVRRYGYVWEVEDESRLVEPIQKLAATDQDVLARKRSRLERELEGIGRVNPLASQEFESLTEREKFLGEQIADVRSSRRHLLKVVGSIEAEVREMFLNAFEDVAREYERLFTVLFPGGQGRLRMTDPNDPLETGVEVEARPGGKNLRRLSLLSGGERALSALAVLFAIFRARPSPFYVLDEVEAALDDINLHRFLQLLLEFRKTSQLLVVTHQKRTMEIGDVLYGVSIKPDGASRVISERMTQPASHEMLPAREEI